MKRSVALIMVLALIACFCGCDDQTQRVQLLENVDAKSITVTSQPEGYEYSFIGEDAKTVVDYLQNLNLLVDFEENPDECVGMTWVITIENSNRDIITVYHFGNMFIRAENGPWYKMNYEEANRFNGLLNELNS